MKLTKWVIILLFSLYLTYECKDVRGCCSSISKTIRRHPRPEHVTLVRSSSECFQSIVCRYSEHKVQTKNPDDQLPYMPIANACTSGAGLNLRNANLVRMNFI